MKKIKRYLSDNGFKITQLGTEKYRYEGGRSFENDGTYSIDIFSVQKDNTSLYMFLKVNGRPMYAIGKTAVFCDAKKLFFTQRELIEHIIPYPRKEVQS